MLNIKLFFCAVVIFFVIDLLWLGLIAKSTYADSLGLLMRKDSNGLAPIWWSAIAVYLILALGLILFVIPKADGNYAMALMWGALFGYVIYGVYDYTNYALLANWPLKITLIDLSWGTFLCAVTSLLTTYIKNLLS